MFYNQLFALFTLTLALTFTSCANLPEIDVTGSFTAKLQIEALSNVSQRISEVLEQQESAIESLDKSNKDALKETEVILRNDILQCESKIEALWNVSQRISDTLEQQESAIESLGKATQALVDQSKQKPKMFTVFTYTKMNWFEALVDCKSRGLRLATIESAEEQQQVVNLIKTQGAAGEINFWLSGSDLGRKDNYVWMTSGKAMKGYTAWYVGSDAQEPDHWVIGGEMEHCIGISDYYGYKWNDFICSSSQYYVCDNQS